MKAVVQTVSEAEVTVPRPGPGADDSERVTVGAIRDGLLVLLGVTHTDDTTDARWMAEKIWKLRILGGGAGKDHGDGLGGGAGKDRGDGLGGGAGKDRGKGLDDERSASDLGAPVLLVSQFTLYADTRKGRRPSWGAAAPSDVAEPLVAAVADALRELGAHVETGEFGAMMEVRSVNVGPRTILLEH
jgi:D-tyrosyl-tRNA(Tyr) deacylase